MPILRDRDDLPPTAGGVPRGTLRERLLVAEPIPGVPWKPALLAFVVGLLVGVGWARPGLSGARSEAAALRDEVTAVRAEAQLATTILAAQAGDSAATLGHARDFFAKAEAAVANEVGGRRRVTGAPPIRAALARPLGERETLLAGLAAGDPGAVERLRAHHETVRRAIRGAIAPGARAAFPSGGR